MPVHSNLKEILDDKGISIRQVARETNSHFETVRMLYNDEMNRYPRELIDKLCFHLDIPINKLITVTPPQKDEPVD